jgi:hypothetical protein
MPLDPDRWAEERQYTRNDAAEALSALRTRYPSVPDRSRRCSRCSNGCVRSLCLRRYSSRPMTTQTSPCSITRYFSTPACLAEETGLPLCLRMILMVSTRCARNCNLI